MSLHLTEEQQAVVALRKGRHVVAAGPGAGKTRLLVSRIEALVAEGVAPERILTVSFTKAAAEELKDRVYDGRARRAAISTWHSWGFRVLKEAGFAKDLVEKKLQAIRSIIWELKAEEPGPDGCTAELMADRIASRKIAGHVTPDPLWRPVWQTVMRRYQELLREQQVVDFEDMLLEAARILETDLDVRQRWQRRYDHIQVDETQDNSPLQWRLLRVLAETAESTLVVGDHRQSIYAFAGATPEELLAWAKEATVVHSVTLNWRSTAPIVDVCNQLIAHAPKEHRLGDAFRSRDDADGPAVQVTAAASPGAEASAVTAAIQALLKAGREPRDIAVLYRTRRCSMSLSRAMLLAGVPHVIRGGRSFFEAYHIRVLVDYCRIAARSCDPGDVIPRIIHSPKRFLGADFCREAGRVGWDLPSIDDMVEVEPRKKPGCWQYRWEHLREQIGWLQQPGLDPETVIRRALELVSYGRDKHTLRTALESAVAQSDAGDGLSALDEDWEMLLSLAKEHETLQGFIDEVDRLRGGTASIAETDEPPNAVVLQTIHRSKGTEYPVVFVVQLNEGVCPHLRSIQADHEAATTAHTDEERRIAFVAMSRAAEELCCSYSETDPMGRAAQPSRFLKEAGLLDD